MIRSSRAWQNRSAPARGFSRRDARQCGSSLRLRGVAGIGDAPDGAARILGDQNLAVLVYGDADRATPDFGIVDPKSGGEIVVFAGRHAVLHDHADDFVAGAFRAVP